MRGRGKDVVAFVAVVLAVMWGTWLFVRTRLDLGSSWTDGVQRYEELRGERIRFAVWDEPEPLPRSVNGEEAEARPAISPDGRLLVFATGERGLNADLFVADLVGGEPRDPRPLATVNSAFDELAPAFGPDGLYFASDRSGAAFGLDLWRAPYADGVFGEPAPVGGGVNTAADETDPVPVPGTRALVFASNRPRGARTDYDLYRADPPRADLARDEGVDGDEAGSVSALHALNTPFDERDPALTSDGLTLVFASDRSGSEGGFDLYRSVLEADAWLPPEPLHGVNTELSERGPLLSADGFALYFDVAAPGAPPDLWRARSLELFPVPGPPVSLAEILLLLSLLVLAVLAILAKHWGVVDVIYKCFLISLLVHLLALWLLRDVFPESDPLEGRAEDRVFRVRLAPSPQGTPRADRERRGELELEARRVEEPETAPSRVESGVELAAAAPAHEAIETPRRELEAPARSELQRSEHESPQRVDQTLQEREAPFERLAQDAPGLALDARQASAAPTRDARDTPNRATPTVAASRAAPTSVTVEVSAEQRDAGRSEPTPFASRGRLTPSRSSEPLETAALAQPRESFEPSRAEAPAMALPEVTVEPAPERSAGGAARRAVDPGAPLSAPRPEASDPAALARARPTDEVPLAPPRPSLEPVIARGDPSVDLRDAHAAPPSQRESRRSQRFDATDAPARSQAMRRMPAAGDPHRMAVAARPDSARDGAPVPRLRNGRIAVQSREPVTAPPRGRASRDGPPAQLEVAVRDVPESTPGDAPSAPKRFEPTADLAEATPRRRPPVPRPPPAARRFSPQRDPTSARPEAATLVAAAPPAPAPAPGPDDRPSGLEQTPYRNRFGEEKLRALEEFGGGAETERAVAAGLRYLAGIQSSRGYWGERRDRHEKYRDVRIGKTGLALLAFLGAGHTPGSGTEHSAVTERAIRFLLRTQDARSGHFGDSSAYSHGIATYALAEAFAMTEEERLREPLESALAHVLANQSRQRDRRFFGGWGYYFPDGAVWNNDPWPRVSVTAWQVMALESARIGGLEVPDAAFENAREFLVNAWDSRHGAFRYSHDPSRLNSGYPILPASTPAGLFALSLLGIDVASAELADARRFVLRRAPHGYRYEGDDAFVLDARGNLYFWYYATLAMFRVGGDPWERWNAAMKETLLDAQEEDGSWVPISVYASEYAGDDDGERGYSTAMCVLTLEVYYRYFTPLLQVR